MPNDNCTTPVPRCPQGHAAKYVRPNGDRLWFCGQCDMLFDDSGDDGDISYGLPSRRLDRDEKHKERERERRKQRQGKR